MPPQLDPEPPEMMVTITLKCITFLTFGKLLLEAINCLCYLHRTEHECAIRCATHRCALFKYQGWDGSCRMASEPIPGRD